MGGGLCHSATAMRHITNQDAGDDANGWLKWWSENHRKSQLEWIADGFRLRGYEVDVPPKPQDVPTLLAALGTVESDEDPDLPRAMKYNAMRCLRDSGFEPVAFALANRPVSREVERGLLEYAKRQRSWWTESRVGILPLGEERDEWQDGDYALPVLLTPRFLITANGLVFGPLVLSAVLLIWSLKAGRRVVGTARSESGQDERTGQEPTLPLP